MMDIQTISKVLFFSMQQAGIMANMMQEGIVNEKKETIRRNQESDAHYAMREAKTKVDEMVQEMLLHSVYPYLSDCCSLDVEEDTPFLDAYLIKDDSYVLILDPIDGTLPYIQQRDSFSICAGITHNHDFILAMVYFPARDQLYLYNEIEGCKIYEHASCCLYEDGLPWTLPTTSTSSTTIYVNDRVEKDYIEKLEALGYTVYDDSRNQIGVPDVLLSIASKQTLALCAHTRNLRDLLLGVILSKVDGGYAYDFSGNVLVYENRGRQSDVIFTTKEYKK